MFPKLLYLDLHGTAITDVGLKTLSAAKSLHRLTLGRTKVTDAGLPHLADLPKLQFLNLANTKVTAAGLQALGPLRVSVDVIGTEITREQIETLKKQMPNLNVSR